MEESKSKVEALKKCLDKKEAAVIHRSTDRKYESIFCDVKALLLLKRSYIRMVKLCLLERSRIKFITRIAFP